MSCHIDEDNNQKGMTDVRIPLAPRINPSSQQAGDDGRGGRQMAGSPYSSFREASYNFSERGVDRLPQHSAAPTSNFAHFEAFNRDQQQHDHSQGRGREDNPGVQDMGRRCSAVWSDKEDTPPSGGKAQQQTPVQPPVIQPTAGAEQAEEPITAKHHLSHPELPDRSKGLKSKPPSASGPPKPA